MDDARESERRDAASVFGWMALFGGLMPSQIEAIADDVEMQFLHEGDVLFKQGELGDSFYVILSGKMRVTRGRGSRAVELATLIPGDYMGEEALLYGTPRSATATAAVPTRIARFPKAHFTRLIRTYPEIKTFLAASVSSRRLSRKQNVNWLDKEETIYLMARKHVAYLLISLIAPVILAWVSLPLFYFSTTVENEAVSSFLNWAGLAFFFAGVGWGIWRFIDWSNDFYIVTNQRVIWLEKVIGFYDSRQEAPLSTVLTVGIAREFLGRLLGYGNVIIRTFTGQIVMQKVGFPEQLAGLVEEQLSRSKSTRKKEETAALEQAIRKRLGFRDPSARRTEPVDLEEETNKPVVVVHPRKVRAPNRLQVKIRDFFKVRYDDDGVITFRKHWILLVRKIWLPTLLEIGLFAALIGRLVEAYTFLPVNLVVMATVTFMFVILLWWLYYYLDWSNDIYQISDEQIIDIYRTPLGKEDKKTAQLENILSLEHTRNGIIGLILNYGNVIAAVGSAKFIFTGVYNPAIVEQEIFAAMNERKRSIREAQDTAERERIADWLAAYHRQTHPDDGQIPPNLGQFF